MNRYSILRMKLGHFVLLLILSIAGTETSTFASDQRLRVCSQNLHRFGESGIDRRAERQLRFLLKRFRDAECDLVAVQEVVGDSGPSALRTLKVVGDAWAQASGEEVLAFVGESRDEYIRSGFLVKRHIGEVLSVTSYSHEFVPSLQPLGPVPFFPRPPVVLVLEMTGARHRRFWILNLHQKSRTRSYQDGSGTNFEILRAELAQATRNIVERELEKQPEDTIFVVTGDRNSDEKGASSDVLFGKRNLSEFGKNGGCKIRKDEQAECSTAPRKNPLMVGLFERRQRMNPNEEGGGSFLFNDKLSFLDEIAIRETDLPLVTRANGYLAIGSEGQFYKGSDHKLIWAEFRF